MTKSDKEKIYILLKTASDSIFGYDSPDFPEKVPEFSDDIEENLTAENLSELNNPASSSTILNINKKISECKRCTLCAGRNSAVSGEGVEKPLVLVIGEAPSAEDDKSSLPFTGSQGELLDKMLAAISLSRKENCYITNIVKCRPPQERNPYSEECDSCKPFLDAQIAALKPKAILCFGGTAFKTLFHMEDEVSKVHGKVFEYKGLPFLTTFSPSSLLKNPENKRPAWEDLKIFKSLLSNIPQ